MSNGKKSEEVVYQLWDDGGGSRLEVGPDRDGLGLIEIRFYTAACPSVPDSCFTLIPEDAGWLAKAILRVRADMGIPESVHD